METNWKYTKIPESAFTYWGGPMSYLHYLTLKTFKQFNPDWEITLYRPKHIYNGNNTWSSPEHSTKYSGKDYTDDALNLGINVIEIDLETIGFKNNVPEVFKSNYVTYYILSTKGGVWFDMDILFTRPLSDLDLKGNIIIGDFSTIEVVISFYGGTEKNDRATYFSTGLLMGAPGTEFYKLLFNNITKNFNPKIYMSATNNLYPKLFGNIQGIRKRFPKLHFANLSMDIVYPFKYFEMSSLFIQNDVSRLQKNKRTIGIHWYNGHAVSKNFLNAQNYNKDVTINTIIKELKIAP